MGKGFAYADFGGKGPGRERKLGEFGEQREAIAEAVGLSGVGGETIDIEEDARPEHRIFGLRSLTLWRTRGRFLFNDSNVLPV